METKRIDLPFEVKEIDEAGKFTGWASMYDKVDLGGDVIRRGAFTKTLSETDSVPILWMHDSREAPIGSGKLIDMQRGLKVEGQFDMEDPLAVRAYKKLKAGFMKGLSIGFTAVKDKISDNVRELLEVKLWEISVVTFPMLPSAQVTSVKNEALEPTLPAATPATEPELQPQVQAAKGSTQEPDPLMLHSCLLTLRTARS